MEVIKERISVDEQSSHSCINEGTPPPSMVFPRQLEVKQCHTDKGSDNNKKDEGEEKDTEKGIDLVSPHGCKDVMKLNVDSRERQESRNDHLEETSSVPRNLGGDLTLYLCCAGWSIKVVAGIVLRHDTSQHRQRECNQRVECRNSEDSREWQCTGGSMGQGNSVHPHENDCHGNRE